MHMYRWKKRHLENMFIARVAVKAKICRDEKWLFKSIRGQIFSIRFMG